MANGIKDNQIDEILQFNPKWWWDPIPPWFNEFLDIKIAKKLMEIQLTKQAEVLEIQNRAIKNTLKVIQEIQ